MGRHFGNLAKVRHIITYSLSPFEQRAFPNYFSKGIPNVWRRVTSSLMLMCFVIFLFAAMVLMYLTYSWGNSVHQQGKRKNSADYENDQ
uniref:Cytochrome b-c1 complex subunit 8 n=1 Tax=Maylandia zebra TaxID=106582 RepID=A0A3P9DE87_9CICH